VTEKIGLAAIFQDQGFTAGITKYNTQVQQATTETERLAAATYSKLAPGTQFAGDKLSTMTLDTSGAHQALDELKGSTEQTAGGMKMLTMSTVASVAAVGGMVAAAIGTAIALIKMGSEIERTQNAYDDLTARIGVDSDAMLAAADKAAGGTVEDHRIMQAANKLMASGVQLSAADMATALELARLKAHQFGITTEEAFNKIVAASQKGASRGIRDIGIYVNMSDAMDATAESLGGLAGQQAESERATAAWTAIIAEGRRQLAEYGPVVSDTADNFERFDANVKEVKDSVGAAAVTASGTADKIVVMAEAAMSWVGAAISGKNAGDAFNETMLRGAGASDAEVEAWKRSNVVVQETVFWMSTELAIRQGLLALQQKSIDMAGQEGIALKGLAAAEDLMVQSGNALLVAGKVEEKKADIAAKAAQDIIKAQDKADADISKANADLAGDLSRLWSDYTAKRASLMQDIANVDAKLAADLLALEVKAAADREKLHTDMLRAMEDAEQAYNQAVTDANTDLNRDLEKMTIDYRQKREDLLTDLSRDMEKMEADHLTKLADMQAKHLADAASMEADHLADMAALNQDYQEKLLSIEQRYADERASIEAKYRLSPAEDTSKARDAQRETLLEELRGLQDRIRQGDVWARVKADAIQKQLDELKAQEIAELDARKQAEIDELNKWLGAEQAARDAAYVAAQVAAEADYQAQLAAEQTVYQAQRTARQTQYEEQLADARTQYEREKADRQAAYQQEIADLALKLQRAREDAQAAYAQRLADLDVQLAAEKARLDLQATEDKARLAQQLADEQASYESRAYQLQQANAARIAEITRSMEEERLRIRTEAQQSVIDYIDQIKGLGPAARQLLLDQAANDLQPALDDWVRRFAESGAAAAKAVMDAIGSLTHSPPPWAIKVGADIARGLDIGLGGLNMKGLAAGLQANIGGTSLDLGRQMIGAGNTTNNSVANTRNYNLHANFPPGYSYPDLKSAFRLMEMTG
jgi:hypothetical protein